MKYSLIAIFIFFSSTLFAQIPAGYYNNAQGLTGPGLKSALHNIINNHTTYPYTSSSTDVWDILQKADQDAIDTTKVVLIYTGRKEPKWNRVGQSGANANAWNREHVWPQSHGNFGTSPGPGTDCHHIAPSDASVNADRGNLDFDNGGTPHQEATGCKFDSDSWEPRNEVKGDVARMIFYMATRYETPLDLEVNNQVNNNFNPFMGKLSTLVQWHYQDTVDAFEKRRNNVIYSYQGNRNPFIDHPEYVTYIFDSTFTGLNPIKPEPTNHVTYFKRLSSLKVDWTDPTSGNTLPTHYLVKISDVSFNAIQDPADGQIYADGKYQKNIAFGVQIATFQELIPNKKYYVKIFPYNLSTQAPNYKTGVGVPQIQVITP